MGNVMWRDWAVGQDMALYGADDHAVWRKLYRRQRALATRCAARDVLAGLDALGFADSIPDLEQASDRLERATGWRLVGVEGIVPDHAFFAALAARRFPVTTWIRGREALDYLVEPDVFHDFFGHVPLLLNPVFGDFLEAYGRRGLAARGEDELKRLARLYWYTVEFGLVAHPHGVRALGAGLLSSYGELDHATGDPAARRVRFDLDRVLRTTYLIDRYQATYFVLDGLDQLYRAVSSDLDDALVHVARLPDLAPDAAAPGDIPVTLPRAAA